MRARIDASIADGGSASIEGVAAGSTRAIDELVRAGVRYTLHEYAAHPPTWLERGRAPAWGDEAAAALGVDPIRIHKTLVASVDGRLTVAVVPVAAELDLKRLAEALGGRRGGISPLGQRRRLPTVVDSGALGLATIFVSAGRRGLQVELAPADLIRLSDAIVAGIARVS